MPFSEAPYPSGKGAVCKTAMRRFEPARRLQTKLARSAAFDHIAADRFFATSRLFSSLRETPRLFRRGLTELTPRDIPPLQCFRFFFLVLHQSKTRLLQKIDAVDGRC